MRAAVTRFLVAAGMVLAAPLAAPAQEGTATRPDCPPGVGCVTRLPLPRYVSVKGAEANARRGPGADHRIDWVYRRPGLPLRITAEYENWRRVEDSEGQGGWMHYALLSSTRMALVTADMAELRSRPAANAEVSALFEAGVVARLLACEADWCRVSRDGMRGWLPKTAIWGVGPAETFK